MASLTAKQESFIKLMTESEELARRGFELLLKRIDYDQFFDALKGAGLFDPTHNPAPIPAEEEGYVRIPYWSTLEYLTAVARLSGERNDLELANKVMTVVRSVATWRDPEGCPRENYHTAHKFAGIFGLVPTAAVAIGDLEFIPVWLSDRFERMLVGSALSDGALRRFLSSSSAEDLNKAVLVLRYCTAIEWRIARELGEGERKATMAVDDYWVKLMISAHARAFGEKIGGKAAEVFLERVREVFGTDTRRLRSQLIRPTIEDHFQNHRWKEAENCSVEGLRDVLLSWCEHDPVAAKPFVEKLLADEMEILRRMGIYVLSQQWPELRDLYPKFLSPKLFDSAHLHELYNLLSAHFVDLTNSEKADTIEAIRQVPVPTWADDPVRALKRVQQRWLSAVAGKGYAPADEWFAQLQSDSTVGRVSEHPDFNSHFEVRVGPGATSYSVAELVAFAAARIAVEKLNTFEERDPWRGPTMDGLTAALEEAVRTAPEPFLQVLPDFLQAKRRFQYSLISGLKQAWEAPDRPKETDWNKGWQNIIAFFEQLISNAEFWQEEPAEDSRRDWVASAVADCLHAGTNKDDCAHAIELLPRTQALLAILLDQSRGIEQAPEDPMTQALNWPKGRAIEALFSQALRVCRVGDRASNSHEEQWNGIRPLFDAELAKCKNANYEFSTLSGVYIAQLGYMDAKWTKARILQIFPSEFPINSVCAVDGLGYASFTLPVYKLLVESGVLDRALGYDLKGRGRREKLLERIAAAYLWGEESLESPRVSHIFESEHIEDIETVTRVLWMVRGEGVSEEQKVRVIQYWNRCIAWSRSLSEPPIRLLSSLSLLSCFLTTADGRERELLEAVAPYVYVGHHAYEFVDELVRLVEASPDGVSAVLGRMIQARVPDFDFKDQLKTLLLALAEKGKKQDVISHAERLRSLPGMQELFDRLTRSN
ncbi:MAG TPA: hypothetical protein VN176_09630 [Verrucomicrobiae bacterium]|jgi:hypothetical protein|nr:hypothetical protein [Verrucomicrobiae bacterium]